MNPNIGTNKAWAATIAGAIVTISVVIAKQFNFEVSADLASAVQTLLVAGLVYFVPHGG